MDASAYFVTNPERALPSRQCSSGIATFNCPDTDFVRALWSEGIHRQEPASSPALIAFNSQHPQING